jgi:hypothetical protein
MAHSAAHAAAIAQAIKASGVLVRVDAGEFLRVLKMQEEPLVVIAPAGLFQRGWRYLVSYKGLAFHTKSADFLPLPPRAEVVQARAISIPS